MEIHCAYKRGVMHVRCDCGRFILAPITVDHIDCTRCKKHQRVRGMSKQIWQPTKRHKINCHLLWHDLVALHRINVEPQAGLEPAATRVETESSVPLSY
jgi:hypothetical protein